MAEGRVVIVNGTSSSGKSTLVEGFVAQEAEAGRAWLTFGIDEFLVKIPAVFIQIDAEPPDAYPEMRDFGSVDARGFRMSVNDDDTVVAELGPLGDGVMRLFHRTVADAARNGFDVIADDCVLSRDMWDSWQRTLEGLDTTFVALTCPDAPAREAARGDRVIGLAAGLTRVVHSFGEHDFTIDTAALDADAAVDALSNHLANDPPNAARPAPS